MRRSLLFAALLMMAPAMAVADDAGPMASGSVAPTASAPALPPGHPHTPAPVQADPPGLFRAPADETEEDAEIPAGTIVVRILDADNAVVPNTKINLGVVRNSVAKGESREHREATTDARGFAHFAGLETGSEMAYRVSTTANGGAFAAMPFRLAEGKGMRVVLHVYDVTSDMSHEQFFETAGAMYLELKDERLLVQQAIRVFNATRKAWVPSNTIIKLPEGFTALQSGMAMSDQGVDPVEGGAKLRGTFPPGEHEVVFSWQLPYSGGKEIEFDESPSPRMSSFVIRAAAAQGMKLSADGFPPSTSQSSEEGLRLLVVAKRVGENEGPIPRLHVSITDLPTRGPAAAMSTLLALAALATGLYVGTRKRSAATGESRSDRDRLLDELTELERARRAGDVGPKTYERARRDIIDDIARTFASEKKAMPVTPEREPEPKKRKPGTKPSGTKSAKKSPSP